MFGQKQSSGLQGFLGLAMMSPESCCLRIEEEVSNQTNPIRLAEALSGDSTQDPVGTPKSS